MKGKWVLTQRGKYVDINCSRCGYTRVADFAYNYKVEELDTNEVIRCIKGNCMNYCENCGSENHFSVGEEV